MRIHDVKTLPIQHGLVVHQTGPLSWELVERGEVAGTITMTEPGGEAVARLPDTGKRKVSVSWNGAAQWIRYHRPTTYTTNPAYVPRTLHPAHARELGTPHRLILLIANAEADENGSLPAVYTDEDNAPRVAYVRKAAFNKARKTTTEQEVQAREMARIAWGDDCSRYTGNVPWPKQGSKMIYRPKMRPGPKGSSGNIW